MTYRAVIAGALLAMVLPQVALAGGDPAKGKMLFMQCRACHTVDAGVPSTVGPNLNGVVGAKAGKQIKYVYSPAMTKSGLVWTPVNLDKFLTRPGALVPGTKMIFGGVAAPAARQDIIAYLATLKGPRR